MSAFLGMQRSVWRAALPTTEKIVLLAIINFYSEKSPQPWPSIATLAERSSLGRTAVLDALAALERAGVIAVRRVLGRPNRYDLSRVSAALARPTGPTECANDRSLGMKQGVAVPPQSADRADRPDPQRREPARHQRMATSEQPVRRVDHRAVRTSPSGGRDQSVWRTGPVRLADTKDPKKEPKKEATGLRARAPASRTAAALELPIAERAKLVLADPGAAERLQPQRWLEAWKIAEAYGRATGRERPLSEFARDSGRRAIVALLAAGYRVEDLEWVAGHVPKQAWWRSGERVRGLGSLSIEVVSRAIGERDGPRLTTSRAANRGLNDEGRRLHRNTLLENAAAGRYGSEIRRAAKNGVRLRELADELEHREAVGTLPLVRWQEATPHNGGFQQQRTQTAVGVIESLESAALRRAARCFSRTATIDADARWACVRLLDRP